MAAQSSPLSLDAAFATPRLMGTVPSDPVWSPDSRHFAFAWDDAGRPQRALWIARRDGGGLRRMGGGSPAPVGDIAWSKDGEIVLSLRGGELWATDIGSGNESMLAALGGGASELAVSPTGDAVAYLKDGDLWWLDLGEPVPVALTDVGVAPLSSPPLGRYSRPEREIGPGIWGGPTFAWSPDGRTIAVHHVDRRGMRAVPFPNYLAPETDPNEVRRGYPGDPNESRTVGLVDVSTRRLELLEIDDPSANQVVDFSWSPDGVLLLDLATDTAVDRWLETVHPGSGERHEIWRSHRPSRIYTAFASAWHPAGERVIFLSDRADR